MIQKIKAWVERNITDRDTAYDKGWNDGHRHATDEIRGLNFYTREQLENVYALGLKDGKQIGLGIAREQASKSLLEILRQQNK